MEQYVDDVTGARVTVLTPGPARDEVVYQTHPMWIRRGDDPRAYLLFSSDRAGTRQPHVLDMKSGTVTVVLRQPPKDYVLSRKDDTLFFLRDRMLYLAPVLAAFDGGAEPEYFAELPDGVEYQSALSLDASEKNLAIGVVLEPEKRWAVAALDLDARAWRNVAEVDFKVGHVQCNPERDGIVMFCYETGGDAPQRMWVVEEGSAPRPFYRETYDEWVTHEVWWGADRAVFTVWPYDDEHFRMPHGVVSADLAAGKPILHSQFPAWHTHGSPDTKWITADDFKRNIWLIDAASGERRLLTQGHLGEGCDNHPHPSFTPDSKGVLFTSSRNGDYSLCIAEWERFEDLPPANEA